MDNYSFSRYRNLNTPIHKINPMIKLLGFVAIIIATFVAQTWITLGVVLGFEIIVAIISRVRIKSFLKTILYILPFFIIMLLLYRIFYSWTDDLEIVGYMTTRLYMFIIVSIIYTSTTREMDMANSIEFYISPLRYIKVPTYEISLMIMLAIRFIPLMLEDLRKIMVAQTSRGINVVNGTLKERIIGMYNSLLPMFVVSFDRADDISNTLIIRGYEIGKKRTKFTKYSIKFIDVLTIILSVALVASVIYLAVAL